jgi:hypothetical protein
MKIKKNTLCTLVLELFFPSIANSRKLKIKKKPKKSKNRLSLLDTGTDPIQKALNELN